MNRLVLPLAALLLALTGQMAGAQQLGQPPTSPFSRPAVSPFLNLTRGGVNPAISYFGLVRPQIQTQAELQQLQAATAQPYLDNGQVLTQPITNTGTGARFLTSNKYFLTTGKPGSGTAGGVSYTQQQPRLGFLPR